MPESVSIIPGIVIAKESVLKQNESVIFLIVVKRSSLLVKELSCSFPVLHTSISSLIKAYLNQFLPISIVK